MRDHVWVGAADDPAWMRGGSYVVTRRIRMLLETGTGRRSPIRRTRSAATKVSGAPLGGANEHDTPAARRAEDADGELVIADGRAHPACRRPSENNGSGSCAAATASATASSRRPASSTPACSSSRIQRDPRRQFIPLQRRLGAEDALNEYIKHVGSGIFAVLPGVASGDYLGRTLFE